MPLNKGELEEAATQAAAETQEPEEIEEQEAEATAEETPAQDSENPTTDTVPQAEAAGDTEGPGTEGGGQPAQSWSNGREYAERVLGLQGASQFAKDEQLIEALAQHRASLYQENERYKRELEQLRLAQQQQQPAAAKEQKAPEQPWGRPEYDANWLRMVKLDETGRATEGNPEIVAKYNRFHDWRTEFVQKFTHNPDETFAEVIDKRAQTLVDKALADRFEQHQQKLHADQFIRDNSNWLYAKDQNGQFLRDPNSGQQIPSNEGRRFYEHLANAEARGVQGYQNQVQYAYDMLQRDLYAEHWRQSQAKVTSQQQKQAIIQNGNRKPNRAGSLAGSKPGQKGAPQNSRLPLRDQLNKAFEANGIEKIDA